MRKFFWCLLRVRPNEKENKDLTALIYKCIYLIEHCPSAVVEINYYEIKIKTNLTTITLWNANKFYAWLHRGSVNGKHFSSIRPSRSAMYDFKECLKRNGYNIYQSEDQQRIDLSNIKC